MIKNNKKIVVGMSGGVDSAVALLLLKKQGWEPIGLTLITPEWGKDKRKSAELTAKKICRAIGAEHFVLDVRNDFNKQVVNYFIKELKDGRTPNPCVVCNYRLKFKKLLGFAKQKGIRHIATGHYAKKAFNIKTQKYELKKAKDREKDQTYYLSLLPQKWLKHIVFPIGSHTKKQIYKLARKAGLHAAIEMGESQDFCFLKNQELPRFLEENIGIQPGNIIDEQGNVLRQHQGTHFHTIGQRKGIGLHGGPYFVKELNREKNLIIVTKNKKGLLKKEAILSPFHFISGETPKKTMRVSAKIRYRHPGALATLFPQDKQNRLRIVFDRPQIAVTPGQFCVFCHYQSCLGAGVIN